MSGAPKTCLTCRRGLDELATGALPRKQADALRRHLQTCAGCARVFDETQATLALLRRLDDEQPPADFRFTLRRRLVDEGVPERPGTPRRLIERSGEWLGAWWAGHLVPRGLLRVGLVATLGAAMALGAVSLPRSSVLSWAAPWGMLPGTPGEVYRTPPSRLALLTIEFIAEEAVDDVEFVVALPEGLHFVSEGAVLPDRELRWRGHLAPGPNPIPVTVRARQAGRYVVAARATGRVLDANQHVVLEVTPG
jgi:hypothetical protein